MRGRRNGDEETPAPLGAGRAGRESAVLLERADGAAAAPPVTCRASARITSRGSAPSDGVYWTGGRAPDRRTLASLNRKVWCVHGRRRPCSRFCGAACPLVVCRSSRRSPDRTCDRRAACRDWSGSARRDERPSGRSGRVRPVAGRDGRGMVRCGALLAGPCLEIDSVSSFSRSRSAGS